VAFFCPSTTRRPEVTDPIVSEFVKLLDANLLEAWEERSAILEFDGGISRDLAEALALLLVIRQFPLEILQKLF
jgi:hypothetical protein